MTTSSGPLYYSCFSWSIRVDNLDVTRSDLESRSKWETVVIFIVLCVIKIDNFINCVGPDAVLCRGSSTMGRHRLWRTSDNDGEGLMSFFFKLTFPSCRGSQHACSSDFRPTQFGVIPVQEGFRCIQTISCLAKSIVIRLEFKVGF